MALHAKGQPPVAHGQLSNLMLYCQGKGRSSDLWERGCVKEKQLLSPSSETYFAAMQGRHAWVPKLRNQQMLEATATFSSTFNL